MKNMLALLAVVVIAFAAIGYHQGWYTLNVSKSADGNISVRTDVDPKKVVDDSSSAIKSAGSYIGNQLDKAGQDAKAGQQPTPASTPTPDPTKTQDKGVYLFGIDLTPKK